MQSEILRFFRVAKNLKQKTIADLLEMSQPNYSDLENGKTKINKNEAEKLAAFFGVSPEIFIDKKQIVYNRDISGDENAGTIQNTNIEQPIESNKKVLHPVLDKMEELLRLFEEEKKELAKEHKLLLSIFEKLVDRLDRA